MARQRRQAVGKLLRDIRGGVAFIAIGAAVGAGAYVLLDSSRSDEPQVLAAFMPGAIYYGSCREALQDGRTNIRRDEPGYRAALDADDDGLACEPYVRAPRRS